MSNLLAQEPRRIRGATRGSALVASLVVVASIAALGAYLVQLQSGFAARQGSAIDRKRSLYVAEAGLAEAVLALSQGKSGALGSEEVPVAFHDGVYWVESERLSDGRRLLTSRAQVGRGQFSVRLVVTPNVHPIGSLGFFGAEGVVIGDGVVIDGYDARRGRYMDSRDLAFPFVTTGAGALVRSNGDIVIDDAAGWPTGVLDPFGQAYAALPTASRALFDGLGDPYVADRRRMSTNNLAPRTSFLLGSVAPGPGRSVLTTGTTAIGALDVADLEAVLPEVVTPATLRRVTGTTRVSTSRTLGDTSIRYDTLEVRAGGQLTLRGPAVVHVGTFVVGAGAKLTLDDRTGPLLIVVDNALRFEYGSVVSSYDEDLYRSGTYISVHPDPEGVSTGRIVIDCAGDLRGILYAPGDEVRIPALLRVWGAVAARRLVIADGAWLTYDRAMRTGGEGMPALPRQNTWSILEENAPPRPVGYDPLRALALAGVEPLVPDQASPEQQVEVRYFDAAGVRRTITRDIDDIDLTGLGRIIGLRWQDPDTLLFSELQRPAGIDPDNLIEALRAAQRAKRNGGEDDEDDATE